MTDVYQEQRNSIVKLLSSGYGLLQDEKIKAVWKDEVKRCDQLREIDLRSRLCPRSEQDVKFLVKETEELLAFLKLMELHLSRSSSFELALPAQELVLNQAKLREKCKAIVNGTDDGRIELPVKLELRKDRPHSSHDKEQKHELVMLKAGVQTTFAELQEMLHKRLAEPTVAMEDYLQAHVLLFLGEEVDEKLTLRDLELQRASNRQQSSR